MMQPRSNAEHSFMESFCKSLQITGQNGISDGHEAMFILLQIDRRNILHKYEGNLID
jgi:hypothetical protein